MKRSAALTRVYYRRAGCTAVQIKAPLKKNKIKAINNTSAITSLPSLFLPYHLVYTCTTLSLAHWHVVEMTNVHGGKLASGKEVYSIRQCRLP
jgi:hypothetical protein